MIVNEYQFEERPALTIRQYNAIIIGCFRRIDLYKTAMKPGDKVRYYFILREITMAIHCKVMIAHVKSQLN